MRRNVRRLNREIGNHGSALPVSTQVSLPLTLPTSYQPRSLEAKIIHEIKHVVGHSEPSQSLQTVNTAPQPASPTSTSSVSEAHSSLKNSGKSVSLKDPCLADLFLGR